MSTVDDNIVFPSAVVAITGYVGAVSACYADFGSGAELPMSWRVAMISVLSGIAVVATLALYMEVSEDWSLVRPLGLCFRSEMARNLSHPEPTVFGFLVRRLMRQVNRPRRDLMVSSLGLEAGENVCELGSADGQALPAICRNVTSSGVVVAMDPSAEAILGAKSFIEDAGLERGVDATVTFVCDAVGKAGSATTAVSAARASVPAGFDAVCHCNCVYFWPELKQGMREVFEMLKPGGRTVFYAVDDERLESLAALSSPTPFVNTKLEGFLAAVRAAGFVDIVSTPIPKPTGGAIVRATRPC
jgi:SAM-dependent methyltransferase